MTLTITYSHGLLVCLCIPFFSCPLLSYLHDAAPLHPQCTALHYSHLFILTDYNSIHIYAPYLRTPFIIVYVSLSAWE